jgi:hypothetical protein
MKLSRFNAFYVALVCCLVFGFLTYCFFDDYWPLFILLSGSVCLFSLFRSCILPFARSSSSAAVLVSGFSAVLAGCLFFSLVESPRQAKRTHIISAAVAGRALFQAQTTNRWAINIQGHNDSWVVLPNGKVVAPGETQTNSVPLW